MENKELNYAEVVELAEQICPENAYADDLFDEVSLLNGALLDIPDVDFHSKSTEEKWKAIFKAEGAMARYKNLYRIVSVVFWVFKLNLKFCDTTKLF